MYKKIKYKDKYRICPICGEIINIYDTYHIKKCIDTVDELLKELMKGAKTNDREH